MNKKLLLIPSLFVVQQQANAQAVGVDAYMKGNYIEVGVDGAGGFEGTDTTVSLPPFGMHGRSNTQYFGFVANPQMDGWINYDGDFYTPGSPENGWGIEFIDTTTTDTFNIKLNNNRAGFSPDIPGSITSYSYVGGLTTVTWHGDYLASGYDLDFDITYELFDTDLFYTTTMTIFNNGPANIEELYYFRNIDPDNNVTLIGDYVTTNTIVSQPVCCTSAVVKAEQSIPWLSTFAFFSNDTSARVSYGGFSNRDASDIWNGTGGLTNTMGSVYTGDVAVSLAFYQPGLVSFTRAGTSTVSFEYQTVFSASALNDLINGFGMGIEEKSIDGLSIYPNPANDVLNISSTNTLNKVTMYNALGTVVYTNANANTNGLQIDISSFKNGVYILNLEDARGTVTKKIIKK
jgi:Secretion system C-terminal sorting domain